MAAFNGSSLNDGDILAFAPFVDLFVHSSAPSDETISIYPDRSLPLDCKTF